MWVTFGIEEPYRLVFKLYVPDTAAVFDIALCIMLLNHLIEFQYCVFSMKISQCDLFKLKGFNATSKVVFNFYGPFKVILPLLRRSLGKPGENRSNEENPLSINRTWLSHFLRLEPTAVRDLYVIESKTHCSEGV